MTTYLPQLTIPHQVFASAPASILLPVTLGTAVGYSTRRKFSSPPTSLTTTSSGIVTPYANFRN